MNTVNSNVRMNPRVTFVAVVPICIALALINIVAWWTAYRVVTTPMSRVAHAATSQINRRIELNVHKLRIMAELPMTESLLKAASRQTSAAQRRAQAGTTSAEWQKIPDDDLRVRQIMDNSLAEIFRGLSSADNEVISIYLTDNSGYLLAASSRLPAYDLSSAPWWKPVRDAQAGDVVSEGLAVPGVLGLVMPMTDPSSGRFRGALRLEVDLQSFFSGLDDAMRDADATLAVVGSAVTSAANFDNLLGDDSKDVIARLTESGSGWHGGLRFSAFPLSSPVKWAAEPRLVVIRNKLRAIAFMGAGLLILLGVSTIAAMRWVSYCEHAFQSSIVTPHAELLEAGDWILRTALGRPSLLAPDSSQANATTPGVTPLQKDLQKWLHRLLQDLQDEYASQTDEMQRDLSLARDFQLAYIDRVYPRVPAVHVEGRLRLEFYHRYEPALALGGDFYNILTLGQDCAGVFVSDVMGHGTRSALITAIIRTLIDDLEPQGRNARHFLTEMNRLFCGLLKSVPNPLFASAFYFVADTTARVATYSSAGHPAPFHVRRSVGRVLRMEVPMPRGAALGMIPDEKYTGGYCRLIDGDLFLFFTDGVYEANNTHGEEFGIARMEEVLRKLMYKTAQEIVDGLMDAIANFVSYEPIMDDICIVAVEVTTKGARIATT